MDFEEGASPSYFNPEDLITREKHRRYRTQTASSILPLKGECVAEFSDLGLLEEAPNIRGHPNIALILEEIKQEVENFEADGFVKVDDILADDKENIFNLFASLLDPALQGSMSFCDLILRFEYACRNVSESIRYGSNGRRRLLEDNLQKQKEKLLLDEAASWSLLWYLFAKGSEEVPEDLVLLPPTSHLEACQYVAMDHTAQLCMRIVQWLEGLALQALEMEQKVRGCHVGSYLPCSGIWHHTQRLLKKSNLDPSIVEHLDFDAPTREGAHPLPDDTKQDESLLEDVWTLIKAGRLEEACELCRSAGQPWRAITLCPFGGLETLPSIEALRRNGRNISLQAIELQSGIGRQRQLWRWASYCASEKIAVNEGGKYECAVYASQCSNLKRMLPVCMDWESACWAMAKSWLDFQVDIELSIFQKGNLDMYKSRTDAVDEARPTDKSLHSHVGVDSWPSQVVEQQPCDLNHLLQKLHSSELVHECVSRACKEQHRQIEMSLMVGDIAHLLDLIWSWVCPSNDAHSILRSMDGQMIRFGAHLVIILRYLLANELEDAFKEKLVSIGDLILHMYTMFLFSKRHEELVGLYASQLASHHCIDLFVQMMELKLNSSMQDKYKLFISAINYLPFFPENDSKACFEDIMDRVLERSREVDFGLKGLEQHAVAEKNRLQSLHRAHAVQWLCFTLPATISDSDIIGSRLIMKALAHSNILLREFALMSMRRNTEMPSGAHMILSFLAEPIKQIGTLLSRKEFKLTESLLEFENWREYYSCDALYRNWLKLELHNRDAQAVDLSSEEIERSIAAARETTTSILSLLVRNCWLNVAPDFLCESFDPVYLDLHATATLCLPSGECLRPDATLCTTLISALYSSVDEAMSSRNLVINVDVCMKAEYVVEILLRCLAVEGDGIGPPVVNDGGFLASVLAPGFKGELTSFKAGIILEISRLDAWYVDVNGSLRSPATYILWGLCRRCCIPELILRCMQVLVFLASYGVMLDAHDQLIDLVASPDSLLIHLFSQHQLKDFLLFEREYSVCTMDVLEKITADDA